MRQDIVEHIYYSNSIEDIKVHSHNCCQIVFLKKGKINLTVGTKVYAANAPCIFFVSNLENHAVYVESHEYERYCAYINHQAGLSAVDQPLFAILENRPEGFEHVLDVSPIKDDVQWIFEKLLAEKQKGLPLSQRAGNMLIMYLLITIYRYSPKMFQNPTHTVSVVSEIQRYIGKNYMKDISLDLLAKKYHLSRYYLSHLFKKTTGYAPIEYLNMYRLALARNLLIESELTVSEICGKTGFSDLSNFSRSFKNRFGSSPTAYRKKFKL
ncbi:MAG TPA: helix-turn-helix transcriptional regulator [Clostridiales bacterium]|nr:helix-turn-helix transcriptional regulator [Clostridiales bacterium]